MTLSIAKLHDLIKIQLSDAQSNVTLKLSAQYWKISIWCWPTEVQSVYAVYIETTFLLCICTAMLWISFGTRRGWVITVRRHAPQCKLAVDYCTRTLLNVPICRHRHSSSYPKPRTYVHKYILICSNVTLTLIDTIVCNYWFTLKFNAWAWIYIYLQ